MQFIKLSIQLLSNHVKIYFVKLTKYVHKQLFTFMDFWVVLCLAKAIIILHKYKKLLLHTKVMTQIVKYGNFPPENAFNLHFLNRVLSMKLDRGYDRVI